MAMAVAGSRRQPEAKCPVLTGLAAYLQRCGGKDTLWFDTPEEAAAAARAIRGQNVPSITVESQYQRVTLSLCVTGAA